MQPVAPSEPTAPTSGLPSLSVDWLQLFYKWGGAGAVAFALSFLIQFIGGDFNTALKANTDKVDQLAVALAKHQAEMQADEAARVERDRREFGLLRGICLGVNQGNHAAEQLCGSVE